jgi:hypothetical protein
MAFSGGGIGGDVYYKYGLVRFVDGVNGNDANDGGILKPFQTISAALASITDATTDKRYLIDCAAGTYNEGGNPITWKSFIGLFGKGTDDTMIPNGINYTAAANEVGRMDWMGCNVATCNIDCSLASNTNVRLLDFRCAVTWNGGPGYNITEGNNLLCHSSIFTDLTVVDGAAHLFDNMAVLSSITVQDGPVPTSTPILEVDGGLIQGTISLTGKANVICRGVENTANMTGTIASGTTPTFETDAGSMTTGTITGPIKFLFDDYPTASPTTAFTVTKESFVFADATTAAFAVTLPLAANFVGKPITIKKIDVSTNAVTVTPTGGDTIDGAANVPLATQYAKVTISSNGTNWFQV